MSLKAFQGDFMFHPSGLLEVYGTTYSNRHISVYLGENELEKLAKIFELAKILNISYGHASWHIENNQLSPCSICTMKG